MQVCVWIVANGAWEHLACANRHSCGLRHEKRSALRLEFKSKRQQQHKSGLIWQQQCCTVRLAILVCLTPFHVAVIENWKHWKETRHQSRRHIADTCWEFEISTIMLTSLVLTDKTIDIIPRLKRWSEFYLFGALCFYWVTCRFIALPGFHERTKKWLLTHKLEQVRYFYR